MAIPTDQAFAKLAKKMRFLTDDLLAELREKQKELEQAGARASLSDLAQTEHMLEAEHVAKVHLACEFLEVLEGERKLGALAVEKGLASEEEVAVCVDTLKYEFASKRRLPRRLTEIMVEAEILTADQVRDLLAVREAARVAKLRPSATAGPVREVTQSGSGSSARLLAVARTPSPKRAEEPTIPYDEARLRKIEEDATAEISPISSGDIPDDGGVEKSTGAMGIVEKAPGQPDTRRVTARMILEEGAGASKVFPLTGKGRIGRQIGCMIRIDDSRASREHTQIDYDTQLRLHIVSDLGSRNGTYVNDVKIAEPTVLNPGDRVRIGDTVLRYEA